MRHINNLHSAQSVTEPTRATITSAPYASATVIVRQVLLIVPQRCFSGNRPSKWAKDEMRKTECERRAESGCPIPGGLKDDVL